MTKEDLAELDERLVSADLGAAGNDRRQEIVFMGAPLQQATIEAALDACLATPEEIKAAESLDDPFEAWPEQADDIHNH